MLTQLWHRVRHYRRALGWRGVLSAVKGSASGTPVLFTVDRRDVAHPFFLRMPSSDAPTYEQVFVKQEYDFVAAQPPNTIVDAGANIGLASIYFANRFPDARIIAIEPERDNFELLKKNIAPYPNIIPLHAALWDRNTSISLVDPGLGAWGFMTQDDDESATQLGKLRHQVPAVTVDQVMRDYGLEKIDILKIDIEGAEKEVFRDPGLWIDRVDALIVELHEGMKPGCYRSFYVGTDNKFDDEWTRGENVYLSRHSTLSRRLASPK